MGVFVFWDKIKWADSRSEPAHDFNTTKKQFHLFHQGI